MHLHLPGDQSTDPAKDRVLVVGGVWQGDGEVPEHLAKLGVRASGVPKPTVRRLSNAEHGRKGADATKRGRGKRR